MYTNTSEQWFIYYKIKSTPSACLNCKIVWRRKVNEREKISKIDKRYIKNAYFLIFWKKGVLVDRFIYIYPSTFLMNRFKYLLGQLSLAFLIEICPFFAVVVDIFSHIAFCSRTTTKLSIIGCRVFFVC